MACPGFHVLACGCRRSFRYGIDVRPGDELWDHAKWVFKCSTIVGITAVEHLSHNHLVYANLVSTFSRENLGRNHPVRVVACVRRRVEGGPRSLQSLCCLPAFLRSFLPSFLRSFVPSVLPSFIHSFIHSFLLSFFNHPSTELTVCRSYLGRRLGVVSLLLRSLPPCYHPPTHPRGANCVRACCVVRGGEEHITFLRTRICMLCTEPTRIHPSIHACMHERNNVSVATIPQAIHAPHAERQRGCESVVDHGEQPAAPHRRAPLSRGCVRTNVC